MFNFKKNNFFCLIESEEATLYLSHSILKDGFLPFWFVEGILDEEGELLSHKDLQPEWQITGNILSYDFHWGNGYQLKASLIGYKNYLDLSLVFTNGQDRKLKQAYAAPCLQFKSASEFIDNEGERSLLFLENEIKKVSETRRFTYPGWWRNVQCYAIKGQPVQTHQGFLVPYRDTWQGRWGVSPDIVDYPLIASQRRDEKALVGIAFAPAYCVSKNYNPSHHCIHSYPLFGNLNPGETAQAKGRIWFLEAEPMHLLAKYKAWLEE